MNAWRYLSVLFVLTLTVGTAWGIPTLQIYVENGTYDTETETWVVTDDTSPVRLWCIGNTDGPGSHGDITDVRLAIAYIPDDGPVSINITPSTTGGFGGFDDPSTPSDPTWIQTVTDGSVPLLSDGSELPQHGVYNMPDVEWQEFALGDFTLNDSPIADFIDNFPTSGIRDDSAQINVYELDLSGAQWFHFDLYDTTQSPMRAVFAPFSHDGGWNGDGTPPVPEPGTVALVGLGMIAVAVYRKKKTA